MPLDSVGFSLEEHHTDTGPSSHVLSLCQPSLLLHDNSAEESWFVRVSVCLCVCVCVCVRVYVCVQYERIYIRIYIHTYIHKCVCECVCVRVRVYRLDTDVDACGPATSFLWTEVEPAFSSLQKGLAGSHPNLLVQYDILHKSTEAHDPRPSFRGHFVCPLLVVRGFSKTTMILVIDLLQRREVSWQSQENSSITFGDHTVLIS
jgi:hypothetical protein